MTLGKFEPSTNQNHQYHIPIWYRQKKKASYSRTFWLYPNDHLVIPIEIGKSRNEYEWNPDCRGLYLINVTNSAFYDILNRRYSQRPCDAGRNNFFI